MKKFITCLMLIVLTSLFAPIIVKAETATVYTVNGDYVNVRIGPGTSYLPVYVNGDNVQLVSGNVVTYLDTQNDSSNIPWYHISFSFNGGTGTGYIRNDFVTISTYTIGNDADFETYLTNQGFPQSYWSCLEALHAQYPNWTFKALDLNLDWNTAVSNESAVGKSLIPSTRDLSYRSTDPGSYNWDTDTWTPKDGNSWYAANSQVVAYYLDPRNFLDIYHILMFEPLSYQSSYQTLNVVEQVLNGTFMAGGYAGSTDSYAQTFVNAGASAGVSPIFLAARARQEQGTSGSAAITGGGFTYNNQYYSGLYNFYNIGATSGTDAVYKGLIYANGGENGTAKSTTYGRPWNSISGSIIGGAQKIGASYISIGQDTLYLQKWDVLANAQSQSLYTNQYMTNIEAPKSESYTSYNAYSDYGLLDEALTFNIPVFDNMPASTSPPTTLGNPNNYLNDLTVNNNTIANFDKGTTTYSINVPSAVSSINIGATKISSSATITSGTGTTILANATTAINVIVKAGNGTTKTYTINVLKSDSVPLSVSDIINNLKLTTGNGFISGIALNTDAASIIANVSSASSTATTSITDVNGVVKSSGTIATGDNITLSSNGESITNQAVIYGDVDGDGKITIKDLLIVQKKIMGSRSLSGSFSKAADPNRDGSIDIKDLLKIQKHLLGASQIEQ